MSDMRLRTQAKLDPPGQAQYWTAEEMQALHEVLAEKDATIDDLRVQLATAQREAKQQDSDWLAVMKAIAVVVNALDSDNAWTHTDDGTLLEQFDPWQALREIGKTLATQQAATPVALDMPDGVKQDIGLCAAAVVLAYYRKTHDHILADDDTINAAMRVEHFLGRR